MGTNDTSATPGAGQSTELQQESSNTGGTAGSEADIHEPGNTPAAKGPKPAKGKRENTSIFDSDEKTPITSNFSISKILGPIAIVFTIVVLLAIILYLKKFASPIFSDDKDHWTQFGNFFAAVLNPYLSALLVITTVYIAWWLNNYEKKRDAALKKEADVKSYLELYQYYTSPEFREKRTIAWQVLVRAIENDEYAEYLVDQAFAGRYGARPADEDLYNIICPECYSQGDHFKQAILYLERENRHKLDAVVNFFQLLAIKDLPDETFRLCDFYYDYWRPMLYWYAKKLNEKYENQAEPENSLFSNKPRLLEALKLLDKKYLDSKLLKNISAKDDIDHPIIQYHLKKKCKSQGTIS
jgi:hypothetical protein